MAINRNCSAHELAFAVLKEEASTEPRSSYIRLSVGRRWSSVAKEREAVVVPSLVLACTNLWQADIVVISCSVAITGLSGCKREDPWLPNRLSVRMFH